MVLALFTIWGGLIGIVAARLTFLEDVCATEANKDPLNMEFSEGMSLSSTRCLFLAVREASFRFFACAGACTVTLWSLVAAPLRIVIVGVVFTLEFDDFGNPPTSEGAFLLHKKWFEVA